MFLRNERSLGVKNGTLGQVQPVTQARVAVLLDDGRSIAFDVKDYANVDHGYAATIHKAQRVTVDRVHVLATPGLDRHAAYVALSRHRDSADLHYGRDDFADRQALTRVLSRERGKDMASDYPAPEPVKVQQPQHDPFAGLKLPTTSEVPELSPFEHSVVRVARCAGDILRMRTGGGEELPHQRAALKKAVAEMEGLRPGVRQDLQNAFNADHSTLDDAANGRPQMAIRAMALEAEMRANPERRADQFVAQWRALQTQSDRAYVAGDMANHKAIRNTMAGMAMTSNAIRKRSPSLRCGKRSSASPSKPGASLARNWRLITGSTSAGAGDLAAEFESDLAILVEQGRFRRCRLPPSEQNARRASTKQSLRDALILLGSTEVQTSAPPFPLRNDPPGVAGLLRAWRGA